jgi:hypothetical protein
VTIYDNLLRQLDKRACLGFRIWDFSFRSLARRYGNTFLKEVAFRHPLRTLAGLLAYRRLVNSDPRRGDITYLFPGTEEEFQNSVVRGERGFLVAVGFCQKPMRETGHRHECPEGRFNHRCFYLAQMDLSGPQEESLPPACRDCEIKVIGRKALRAGANVHIMTSALDIAYDIFVPTLKQGRFKTAIFCVCPYSVHPMVLPLLICGIEGFVVQFNSGYCVDYSQWSLADTGTKNERTLLSQPAYNKILAFLDDVAALRAELKKPCYHCFRQEGNIYAPMA